MPRPNLTALAALLLIPSFAFGQQPPRGGGGGPGGGGNGGNVVLGAVPVPAANPITAEKAILGKILFWDEQLSSDNTVACGSCHIPEFAGSDPREAVNPGPDGTFNTPDDVFGSFGVMVMDTAGHYTLPDGAESTIQVTGRTAPALSMNPYAPLLFWDGRAGPSFVDPVSGETLIAAGGALEAQAIGPIMSDAEMAAPGRSWDDVATKLSGAVPLELGTDLPADVVAALAADPTYGDLFTTAFGDPAITPDRIAIAIATYERTLIPDQTPFDLFQAGDATALDAREIAGMNAFNGSTCDTCHAGALFTDNSFRNIGVRPVDEDLGRAGITGNNADEGRFRVPSLRNVALKTEFMHNGEFVTLRQVIDFYVGGGQRSPNPDNLDPLVPPIAFPGNVRDDIVAFLGALTDPRVAVGAAPFDRPSLSASVDACSDGVDNDGDGFIDYGEDGGCASVGDSSEGAHDVICDDGLDNDHDGLIDGDDTDCDGEACSDLDGDLVCDEDDVLLEVSDLFAASSFTLTATGTPGLRVLFAGSRQGVGDGPCHQAADVCSDLLQPLHLGTVTLDADGVGSLDASLPARVPAGRTITFQALMLDRDAGSGESSNLVERVVLP